MSIDPQVAILLAVMAVSTGSIFARLSQEEAPSLIIAAYRMVVATLFFLPAAVTKYRQNLLNISKKQLLLLTLSGSFLALHFASWITSLEYTTVASSVVLVSTVPLWVALFSSVFLREKLGPMLIVGLVIALAGVVIVSLGESCAISRGSFLCTGFSGFLNGENFTGNLLALIGALGASGYIIVGRKVRQNVPVIPYAFMVYGFSAILLIVGAIFLHQELTGYSLRTYGWMVALALFPQVIGHSTYNWALGYLPATFVAVVLLGEPIGASLLALVFLGEIPAFLELVGGCLILLGIYLAARAQNAGRNSARN